MLDVNEKRGLIYYNIHVYRLLMTLLYGDKYRERFQVVLNLLGNEDVNILALCFGDTVLAKYCRDNHKNWIGIDSNENFVSSARRQGFDAHQKELTELHALPKSDVCIMIGSLYHFWDNINAIMKLMLNSSKRVIISEPIVNFSNGRGPVGSIARKLTAMKGSSSGFRYNENTLLAALDGLKNELNFKYYITGRDHRNICLELKNVRN